MSIKDRLKSRIVQRREIPGNARPAEDPTNLFRAVYGPPKDPNDPSIRRDTGRWEPGDPNTRELSDAQRAGYGIEAQLASQHMHDAAQAADAAGRARTEAMREFEGSLAARGTV